MKIKRHLDSEYRDHYQFFYTAEGRKHDSRITNWREIAWENVIRIDVQIKGNSYTFKIDDLPNVLGFLNFRWGGVNRVYDRNNEEWKAVPINLWTVGYILPKNRCILTDIDFHTGKLHRHMYKHKTGYFKDHIHPRLKPKLNVKSKIIY